MQPLDPSLARLTQGAGRPVAADAILLEPRLQLSRLGVGDEVNARVLSERAGGRFTALIDGRQVEIALPRGARAGETVRLVVAADQPRLLLVPREDAGTAGAGGSRLAAAPVSPAAYAFERVPAGARQGAGGADVLVSAGARALGRLVGDIATAAAAQPRTAAGSAAGATAVTLPLLQAAPTARDALAPQLAAALSKTFATSGLFYESHQAQWVAGARSLESLKSEPQGRLAPLVPRTDPAGPAARAAGAIGAAGALAESAGGAVPRETLLAPAAQPAGADLARVLDPALAPLVQQQLSALDERAASWSGWVLPGMQLGMTVHERIDQESGAQAAPGGEEWTTRLAVSLPRLGAIDAQLVLRGDRLLLAVSAGEAATAAELSAARAELMQVLQAAGLRVETLQVGERIGSAEPAAAEPQHGRGTRDDHD
jgi:hypothetical protein